MTCTLIGGGCRSSLAAVGCILAGVGSGGVSAASGPPMKDLMASTAPLVKSLNALGAVTRTKCRTEAKIGCSATSGSLSGFCRGSCCCGADCCPCRPGCCSGCGRGARLTDSACTCPAADCLNSPAMSRRICCHRWISPTRLPSPSARTVISTTRPATSADEVSRCGRRSSLAWDAGSFDVDAGAEV